MSKCKYYIRPFPDSLVTSCGNEILDDNHYDKYCTYCGKVIKETNKDLPQELIDQLENYND